MADRLYISQSDAIRLGAALYGENEIAVVAFYVDMCESGMVKSDSLPNGYADRTAYGRAWFKQLRDDKRLAIKQRNPMWTAA